MFLLEDAFRPKRLATILLLCFAPLSFAVEPAEKDIRFWEKWNKAITTMVKKELETPDPWEGWNRKVYAFNDVADRYFLTPVAKSYQWVTPDLVEKGVGNVFSNLREINTILNDLLQFKFKQAASDTGRFVVNTTVGLAGIFDVASPMGLEKNNEDFGQTLGYWGVGAGPYLVVPLLGSYNLRDGLGSVVDVQTSYLGEIDHVPTRNQIWALSIIDNRARLFAAEELVTGDKYAFIRDAYLQRRRYLVKDGEVEDSFGEEDYEESWDDAL